MAGFDLSTAQPTQEPAFDEFDLQRRAALNKGGFDLASAVPTGQPPKPQPDISEKIAASVPGRFFLGAASIPMGVTQAVLHATGQDSGPMDRWIARLEEMKKAGGAPDLDLAGIAGSMTTPVGVGGKVIKPATGWLGKTAQNITTGMGIGAATPVADTEDFATKKALQVSGGGLVGGLLAPVVGAGKGIYNVVEPYLLGGVNRGTIRTIQETVGNKYDDIVNALRAHQDQIPGSKATAGEAAVPANSAEFAGLQGLVEKKRPSEYLAIDQAQQDARDAAVGTVAGSPKQLDVAKANRSAAADPLYEAARNSNAHVDVFPVLTKIDALIDRNPGNAPLLRELQAVKKGLTDVDGLPRTDPQEVASTLDGLKTSIANKDNLYIREQLNALKTQISDAIPGYTKAQEVYAEKSIPVNRLQIGQVLQDRLRAPMDVTERAPAFVKATQEAPKTITNATGQSRYNDLAQILNPDELRTVNLVADELQSRALFSKQQQAGTPAAREGIGAALSPEKIPGFLDRTATIARTIIDRLSGKASSEVLDNLSAKMQDPKVMANLMASASPSQKNAIMSLLLSRTVPTISAAASSGTAREIGYSGGH